MKLRILYIHFLKQLNTIRHTKMCKWGFHKWKRLNFRDGNLIYTTRICERCDKNEIQLNGGLGDNSWQDLDTYKFKHDFEKESFEKAIPYNL